MFIYICIYICDICISKRYLFMERYQNVDDVVIICVRVVMRDARRPFKVLCSTFRFRCVRL